MLLSIEPISIRLPETRLFQQCWARQRGCPKSGSQHDQAFIL